MKRIGEIDFFRVVAIVLMVAFHFVFDLNEFANININYESGFWYYVGRTAAILFITISGISSNLSKKPIKNAMKLFIFATGISVATYFVFGDMYVRFGILHLLATMTVLSLVLNKTNTIILIIIQIVSYLIYLYSIKIRIGTFYLIPFGFMYYGFASVDYYPIFPYIIYYILGILIFRFVYKRDKRLLPFEVKSNVIKIISQKSLEIYILHQPIILAVIFVVSKFV